jgi:hypothetical protein
MYWGDVGIKNIAHIHPPAPHSTFEPTSHNLSLRCLVSSSPVAKMERTVAVVVEVTTAAVAMAAVATAAVAVMMAAVATHDGVLILVFCTSDCG